MGQIEISLYFERGVRKRHIAATGKKIDIFPSFGQGFSQVDGKCLHPAKDQASGQIIDTDFHLFPANNRIYPGQNTVAVDEEPGFKPEKITLFYIKALEIPGVKAK